MTNWLPVAIIGFSLLTPAGTRLRNLIMSGELVPKEIAKNTQDDWKTSFQGDFDLPKMFCHFNIISLSTVIIEGWQVIYKPIKIWVANKSPLHSSFMARVSGHKLPSIHVSQARHVSSTRDTLLSPRPHEFHTQASVLGEARPSPPSAPPSASHHRSKTHARSRSDVSGMNKVRK